jgi:LAO/AO transport system kinase
MGGLLGKLSDGDRKSLARAMSLAEESSSASRELRDQLRSMTGNTPWWGFTGPSGVGKSTLIDVLLERLRKRDRRIGVVAIDPTSPTRKRDRRIGVVAIDPTSPTSDGALLGDRVRMMRHAVDENVFIRSLATRHREGGLSDAALHCARLLEVAGFDPVLIETVGVGQNEVDVASIADVCVVILGPGYGDDIQLIKAGLLQIADLVVVNKCDVPEAGTLLGQVREEVGHSPAAGGIEVLGVEARTGAGVDELLERLLALDEAARDPEHRRRSRHRRILSELKRSAMLMYEEALQHRLTTPAGEAMLAQLEAGACSLESVTAQLAEQALDELKQRSSEP